MSKTVEKHLRLLSRQFPDIRSATGELVHLQTLLSLPKGTEFFFSDLHGEDGAFIHFLRSASGTVRNKIQILFERQLTEVQQNELAYLVYNPIKTLDMLEDQDAVTDEWVRITIYRLVELLRFVSSKYPRVRVREKTPPEFSEVIEELLYTTFDVEDRDIYNQAIIQSILQHQASKRFITELCVMIQNVSVDTLHIIGDIFDRGPGPHKIMEELMRYSNVDVQWGNHDIIWMAAAAGSEVAMLSVLRIAISYNGFDCLEDGYGINLRPLYSFAHEVYGDDPCERFMPRLLDRNIYDQVAPEITAKMHKAIAVLQFKLEGQLYARHPEYRMAERNVLHKIDYSDWTYVENGQKYPLLDRNFPTIDPGNPLQLTESEQELMISIRASFLHSEVLQRHVAYLYAVGGTYKVHNNNLLFHGCIPMTEEGEFEAVSFSDKSYSGKALMDYLYYEIRKAWFAPRTSQERRDAQDLMWYLWCGPLSPLFGKSKMATFENYFVADKSVRKEHYNPYYQVSQEEDICDKILWEFGLNPENSHIINGHVPVKIKDGETPVKANGKLYVIDGGISKAYQPKTGIAGYTLIFNSHFLALVEHHAFDDLEREYGSYIPEIRVVERMPRRLKIKDTDEGAELRDRIEDLKVLIDAYRSGTLRAGSESDPRLLND